MKKIPLIIILMFGLWVLTACGDGDGDQEVPTFSHIIVNSRNITTNPLTSPINAEKNQTITVEVHFNNPSSVPITALQFANQTVNASSFEGASTPTRVVVRLSVGTSAGNREFRLTGFNYRMQGDDAPQLGTVPENQIVLVNVLPTNPSVNIQSVRTFPNRLEVNIEFADPDNILEGSDLKAVLRLGSEAIEELPISIGLNSLIFSDLLSNQAYLIDVLQIISDDPLVTEPIISPIQLATSARTSPTVQLSDEQITVDRLRFNLRLSDPSNVLEAGSLRMRLIRGDQTIVTRTLNVNQLNNLSFDNLLSDNDYRVEILGNFDLGDSLGRQTDVVLLERSLRTLARELPNLDLQVLSVSDIQAQFRISEIPDLVDLDSGDIEVHLFDATGTLLAEGHLMNQTITFNLLNLLRNESIELVFKANVDLLDGNGVQLREIHREVFTTLSLITPTANIGGITLSHNEVSFSVSFSDPNNTVIPGSFRAKLYQDSTHIETITLPLESGTFSFDNQFIEAGHLYRVEIYFDYDLKDRDGMVENVLLDQRASMFVLPQLPQLIFDETITQDSIVFDYVIIDNDQLLTEDSLTLTLEGQIRQFVEARFDAITIKNIHVHLTTQAGFELQSLEYQFNTVGKTLLVTGGSLSLSGSEATLSDAKWYFVIDGELITTSAIDFVQDDNQLVSLGSIQFPIVDATLTFVNQFTLNIDEANPYHIIVSGSAFNEHITDQALRVDTSLVTLAAVGITPSSINDLVLARHFDAFSFIDQTRITHALSLTGGSINVQDLLGDLQFMLSDQEYHLVIEMTYDRGDGRGTQKMALLDDAFSTLSKARPTIVMETDEELALSNMIEVRLDVTDLDQTVVPGSLFFGVYRLLEDDTSIRIGQLVKLDSTMTINVLNLLADNSYILRVYGDINLNDDTLIQSFVLLAEERFETDPEEFFIPRITDLDVDANAETITVTIENVTSTSVFTDDLILELIMEDAQGETLEVYQRTLSKDAFFIGGTFIFSEASIDFSSDNQFRIRLIASYNLQDGSGPVVNGILDVFSFILTDERD